MEETEISLLSETEFERNDSHSGRVYEGMRVSVRAGTELRE
jgi:hypothetical protein